MIVSVKTWELHLADCNSLKDKRAILRSLKDRLRGRHNVSVAETARQDTWRRAELSVAVVAPDRRRAQQVLDRADALVASDIRVRIVDCATYHY